MCNSITPETDNPKCLVTLKGRCSSTLLLVLCIGAVPIPISMYFALSLIAAIPALLRLL